MTSDSAPRTKGELSIAVTSMVDRRITPWCPGCEAFRVNDLPFRSATLLAGLGIDVEPTAPTRYTSLASPPDSPQEGAARAELVRRFLHAFGPATPTHLAAWLALTPAAARTWWTLIDPELIPIDVEGKARWALASDVPALRSRPQTGRAAYA